MFANHGLPRKVVTDNGSSLQVTNFVLSCHAMGLYTLQPHLINVRRQLLGTSFQGRDQRNPSGCDSTVVMAIPKDEEVQQLVLIWIPGKQDTSLLCRQFEHPCLATKCGFHFTDARVRVM